MRLTMFLWAVAITGLSAQSQFIGGVFGISPSFVLGKSIFDGGGKMGFRGGIHYTYQGKWKGEEEGATAFLLELGLMYEQRGFAEPNAANNTTVIHHMDYLSYPVKFGLLLKGTTSGYAALKVGLVPALFLQAYSSDNRPSLNPEAPVFDLGAAVDFVLGYVFNDKLDLYVSMGYQQSFFSAQANFFPDQTWLTGNTDISVGLKYKIPF